MEAAERTQDVYEHIPAYTKPPLVPLPDLNDPKAYAISGMKVTGLTMALGRFLNSAIGVTRAYPQIQANLEDFLRHTNLRVPGLYSPLISATIDLADDPRLSDPYLRAATLLIGARSLCDDIFSGALPADTFRGEQLEMGQYPNLFGACMIIENRRARMFKTTNFDDIIVALGGRFYQLHVGHPGQGTTIEQIVAALQALVTQYKDAGLAPDEPAPGILTSASNRTQFRAFHLMETDPDNQRSLQTLRHSLLTVCLDLDHNPASDAEAMYLGHSGAFANRWFHSSLQLVVFGNGKACAICNFTCYLDGNIMMRGAAEIQQRGAACPLQTEPPQPAEPLPAPLPLVWNIDPKIYAQAKRDLELFLDPQQATFEIEGVGRRYFQERKLSPIPVFMLALSMAGRRLTGKTPTITQFLVMSRYRCMDMTTANISAPEVMACVDYLESDNPDPSQAEQHIRQATTAQEAIARQARSELDIFVIMNLHIRAMPGLKRRLAAVLFTLVMLTYQVLGYFKPLERQILVSHPEIYKQLPMVGRPGIRIPYARLFGLHYQIFEDRIVLTYMPSKKWATPNAELTGVIRDCLKKIQALVEDVKPT
jgi:hypothetical protein